MFEGLLPKICDTPVQRVLFIFAQWHGLAKLRLHMSTTIKVMKKLTSTLGNELRAIADLTRKLDVRETPKEYAARRKRYKATAAKSTSVGRKKSDRSVAEKPEDGDGRRKCALNLDTYKMHALGDYTHTIEEYGSTDSYSTQIVSQFLFNSSYVLLTHSVGGGLGRVTSLYSQSTVRSHQQA